jgi:hypothetical protein
MGVVRMVDGSKRVEAGCMLDGLAPRRNQGFFGHGNPERVRFALRPPTCHHPTLASPFGDFGTCTFPTTPARDARALALGLAIPSRDGRARGAWVGGVGPGHPKGASWLPCSCWQILLG